MTKKILKNAAIMLASLLLSYGASLLLQNVFDTGEHINSVFIFAVFIVSLLTDGYIYGIITTLAGVISINYAFTYPYFDVDFSASESIFSAIVMLVISLLTSTLTTKLKRWQELKAEREKVKALDLGANDYVTKPFGSAELLARIRSVLRMYRHSADAGKLPGGKFTLGELVIDYDARRIHIGADKIKLTQTEYNIIAFLSEHCGKMMTYSAIIKAVWRESPDDASIKKLQVNMANIRKKFGAQLGKSSYITNEFGVGYRMNGDK